MQYCRHLKIENKSVSDQQYQQMHQAYSVTVFPAFLLTSNNQMSATVFLCWELIESVDKICALCWNCYILERVSGLFKWVFVLWVVGPSK